MTIISTEDSTQMDVAKQIGDMLCTKYPGYEWVICPEGDVLAIRLPIIDEVLHFALNVQGFCYCLHPHNFYSISDMKHQAMIAGGQMLEAFQLPRDRYDGSAPIVPKSWKRKEQTFQ